MKFLILHLLNKFTGGIAFSLKRSEGVIEVSEDFPLP